VINNSDDAPEKPYRHVQHNVAIIKFIFALYQPGYRGAIGAKESPDSKEQHTG